MNAGCVSEEEAVDEAEGEGGSGDPGLGGGEFGGWGEGPWSANSCAVR
jgi:hypothetical protein